MLMRGEVGIPDCTKQAERDWSTKAVEWIATCAAPMRALGSPHSRIIKLTIVVYLIRYSVFVCGRND
jgi:hypothetical protein